jgi:hypothetical protein
MAFHADAERQGEVEGFLVLQAELSCQLVDPDLLCQVLRSVPSFFSFSEATAVAVWWAGVLRRRHGASPGDADDALHPRTFLAPGMQRARIPACHRRPERSG